MPIHAEDLRRYLATALGRPVELRMNNNTHSMVNVTRAGVGVRVSLHRMFLEADAGMMETLAKFIHNPTPEVRSKIRAFIARHHGMVAKAQHAAPPRSIRGTARGRRFNLEERARAINQRYFGGRLEYRIIWGRSIRAGRRQNHVTLGTWNVRQQVIRIHPMLDLPGVPCFMVDFVIYHEMCHIAVPSKFSDTGRAHHHGPEFRALEAKYPDFARAHEWEARWLSGLIRAWNGGAALPAAADLDPPAVAPQPPALPARPSLAQRLMDALRRRHPAPNPKPKPKPTPKDSDDDSDDGQLTLF